jgi:Xaa-Pro aminopeptidase
MQRDGMAALVLRLPENVVYVTDYWPHHGISVAVLLPEGLPSLFVPEVEAPYALPEWANVETYGWALLKDPDLYGSFRRLLADTVRRVGHGRVGVERGLEVIGAAYRHAEPILPAAPWWALLDELFADAALFDVTDLIQEVRTVKTAYDLERLRVANELAEIGLAEFARQLKPGLREVEASAIIEGTIRARGAGYKGARLVWAEAEVSSGPDNTARSTLLIPSTGRVIEEGDLVMVEMATVMDGYYSDLTYMAVAGEPSARQRQVHNAVLEAQQAAAQELRPGNALVAPDRAARAVLERHGLAAYFVHITGHGLGFRFHESGPFLMAGASGVLEQGMVTSVEPGVYIPGFGGIRIEDDVAVGASGPVFLSTPRKPW